MPCDLPADIFQYLKSLRKTKVVAHRERELVESSCGIGIFSRSVISRASEVINQELLKERKN